MQRQAIQTKLDDAMYTMKKAEESVVQNNAIIEQKLLAVNKLRLMAEPNQGSTQQSALPPTNANVDNTRVPIAQPIPKPDPPKPDLPKPDPPKAIPSQSPAPVPPQLVTTDQAETQRRKEAVKEVRKYHKKHIDISYLSIFY